MTQMLVHMLCFCSRLLPLRRLRSGVQVQARAADAQEDAVRSWPAVPLFRVSAFLPPGREPTQTLVPYSQNSSSLMNLCILFVFEVLFSIIPRIICMVMRCCSIYFLFWFFWTFNCLCSVKGFLPRKKVFAPSS